MRFVIIASPRTGSSHLVSLLNKRRDILCNGEVFHHDKVYIQWPKQNMSAQVQTDLAELRRADPLAFMNHILETGHGRPHVGFKIFRGHNNEMLDYAVKDLSIRKIILYRQNVLANYSSELIAEHTNKWHSDRESERGPQSPKVRFEEKDFIKFHDRYIDFYRDVINRLNITHQHCHVVNYEDINNTWLFANLINYIGADPTAAKLESSLVKQNPKNVVSRFENAEEVKGFLRENQLMHWAHERENKFGLFDTKFAHRRLS